MDTTLMTHAAQAVAAIGLLGTGLGVVLGVAARYLSTPVDDRAEAIAALLPGSNCAQCGYAGGPSRWRAAMVEGRAAPNCCPPGGVSTAQRVAELLGVKLTTDGADAALPLVARVDERRCIGPTRCIRKCGSDAIVGAAKQMHTVLPEACYACGLCVAECPTDAIVMVPVKTTLATLALAQASSQTPGRGRLKGHCHVAFSGSGRGQAQLPQGTQQRKPDCAHASPQAGVCAAAAACRQPGRTGGRGRAVGWQGPVDRACRAWHLGQCACLHLRHGDRH